MSSSTLSEELCRQGSHYQLYHWHSPHPHSPKAKAKPSHHNAFGVDQAKASSRQGAGGGLQHLLGALLRGTHTLAAAAPRQACSKITWKSYEYGRAGFPGTFISQQVQRVSYILTMLVALFTTCLFTVQGYIYPG